LLKGKIMAWFNSIEILAKLILIGQILIVSITAFTIWASVQKNRLENKDKNALVQQIKVTNDATTDLSEKNAILSEELNASKQLIAKLEKKTSPRELTEEQNKTLPNLLSFQSKYQVAGMCRMMDTESYNYAEQLASAFRKAKWKVRETNQTFLDDIDSDVVVAITENEQIEIANKIILALNKAGIAAKKLDKIRENSFSGAQADTIYLIVGTKK
jgi:hypothetical protein